ncbi:ATPase [bacterium]|nr:MAG: ATPase [bacterium]RLE26199.1 MAG: ATPase [Acidobacteriota bacterium]
MKRTFAIPTHGGKSCAHFGHCQSFAVIQVADDNEVGEVQFLDPPAHQPGTYPRFLSDQGVDIVIAGGMGVMAQNLFRENKIEVHMGIGVEEPAFLVEQFLRNELQTGDNLCNHGTEDHEPNCGD